MAGSRRNAQVAETAEKATRAMQMRLAGVGVEVIARELGYSHPASVTNLIKRAMQRSMKLEQQSAEELLQMNLARYERLLAAAWPKALKGEVKSIEICEKIIYRICHITGVDLLNRNGGGDSEMASLLGTLLTSLQNKYIPAHDIVPGEVVEEIEPG